MPDAERRPTPRRSARPPRRRRHRSHRAEGRRGSAGSSAATAAGRRRQRVNKLRLAVILLGLGVARPDLDRLRDDDGGRQDLPSLEATNEFKASQQLRSATTTHAATGQARRPDRQREPHPGRRARTSRPTIKHAVVAIEDERFYSHKGVDYQGIARALWADVRRQQRRRRAARRSPSSSSRTRCSRRRNRSLFQKLKEAALAYQLERKWTEGQDPHPVPEHGLLRRGRVRDRVRRARLLRLEPPRLRAALRGRARSGGGGPARRHDRLALRLQPGPEPGRGAGAAQPRAQADAGAGPTSAPSEYADFSKQALPPRERDQAAAQDQRVSLLHGLGRAAARRPLRNRRHLRRRPANPHDARPRPTRRRPSRRSRRLAGVGPSAALVALDNKTGAVRAMVGGTDFETSAVQPRHAGPPPAGLRVQAVHARRGAREGHLARPACSPRSQEDDQRLARASSRSRTTRTATRAPPRWRPRPTISDNSVYAEVGYKLVGTKRVARTARARWASGRALSTNPGDGARRAARRRDAARAGRLPISPSRTAASRVSGSLAAYDGRAGRLHEGGGRRASTTRTTPAAIA